MAPPVVQTVALFVAPPRAEPPPGAAAPGQRGWDLARMLGARWFELGSEGSGAAGGRLENDAVVGGGACCPGPTAERLAAGAGAGN